MKARLGNPVRCGKCKSENVALTINREPNILVCLDCGHEAGPASERKPDKPLSWQSKDYHPEF